MVLKWFNTRAAAEVGVALADELVPAAGSNPAGRAKKGAKANGAELQQFLQRVDQKAAPLKLGWFGRAKLANAFKWRLREAGVDLPVIDEMTHVLLLRLSAPGGGTPAAQVGAPQQRGASSNKR